MGRIGFFYLFFMAVRWIFSSGGSRGMDGIVRLVVVMG